MGLESAKKLLQRAHKRDNKKSLQQKSLEIHPLQVTKPLLRQQEHLASKHILRIDDEIL